MHGSTLPRGLPQLRTLEDIEERFLQSEDFEGDDKFRLLTTCLYGLNARIRPFPDVEAAAKLNGEVQDRLFGIPGHAEYVARQLREPWEASLEGDLEEGSKYFGIREARFQLLSYMPTPETVREMASFLDDSNHPHPEISAGMSPAYGAMKVLIEIIDDPPSDKFALTKWQNWRDDVAAGRMTYRLKGVGGRYNFKGPVAGEGAGPRAITGLSGRERAEGPRR